MAKRLKRRVTKQTATEQERKVSHEEIVESFRELRKRVKPGAMTVSEMVRLGRRF